MRNDSEIIIFQLEAISRPCTDQSHLQQGQTENSLQIMRNTGPH